MTRLRSIVLSGITTIARVLAGFVSVKIVAVTVGPGGVAILGQFQSFLQLTGNLAHLGITQGVTKYIAANKGDEAQERNIVRTSVWITLVASVSISVLMLIASPWLSDYIFGEPGWSWLFVIAAMSISLGAMNQLFQSIMNGYKDLNDLMRLRTYGIFTTLILTVLLTLLFGLQGSLLALVVAQIAGMGLLYRIGRKKSWFGSIRLKEGPDKTLSKKLLAFAAMTLIAGVLTSLRQMFTRDLIEFHFDMTTAGYWQALNRISDMYLMVITATLSIYYLPRLSEIKQMNELRSEVKRSLMILVPATIAMTLVMYFMRSFIVTVVLSEEFRPIENLMGWQFAGDVLKITSWLLAMVLMVKEKVKAFLILEMVHAVLSLGIFELLLTYSGEGSIGLAHFLAYALYLSMVLMVLIPLMRK